MAFETISLDDRKFRDVLRRITDLSSKGFRPPLTAFGVYMLDQTHQRFQREETPDGQAWAPLTTATLLARAARGRRRGRAKILRDTGVLLRSLTPQATAFAMRLSPKSILNQASGVSAVQYAAPHQFGVKRGRVKVPARPFLGFVDKDVETLLDLLERHLLKVARL